jgi:hypothetical protein
MTMRERVTWAVVLVLAVVGAWYGRELWLRGGVEAAPVALIGVAAAAITILTILLASLAALLGDRTVDERDRVTTYKAQMIRGFFYLALAWAVFGLLLGQGQHGFALGLFAAFIAIEFLSGLVMLALYRRSA